MGLDAEVWVNFKQPPTEARLDELCYQLGCRYKAILWQDKNEQGKPSARVIGPADPDYNAPAAWRVQLMCRYYGKDYERGPALQLYGLLDFLCRQDCLSKVFYGNDGNEGADLVTRDFLSELLSLWQGVGTLPYNKYFDKDHDGPQCCSHQMIRCGWGGKWAKWFCPCCGATAKRSDDGQISFSYKD